MPYHSSKSANLEELFRPSHCPTVLSNVSSPTPEMVHEFRSKEVQQVPNYLLIFTISHVRILS